MPWYTRLFDRILLLLLFWCWIVDLFRCSLCPWLLLTTGRWPHLIGLVKSEHLRLSVFLWRWISVEIDRKVMKPILFFLLVIMASLGDSCVILVHYIHTIVGDGVLVLSINWSLIICVICQIVHYHCFSLSNFLLFPFYFENSQPLTLSTLSITKTWPRWFLRLHTTLLDT